MKVKIILALLIIVLAAGGIYMFRGKVNSPKVESGKTLSGEVVISMTEDGYIPDTIQVTKGTKVRFKNNDKLFHWPASDLHPTHTLYPEFDPRKGIGPGEEWSFVFEKPGEWGMHDHLAPYIVGTIKVVE